MVFGVGPATLSDPIHAPQEKEPIWSSCLYSDQEGLVTGSEDKSVKDDEINAKRLTLIQARTVKMDVLRVNN